MAANYPPAVDRSGEPPTNLRRAANGVAGVRTTIGLARVLVRPWALLLMAEEPTHGYELVQRLHELGFDWGSPTGPVYRELRTLVEEGLLRACPGEARAFGPRRKVYELTPAGHDELARLVEAAKSLSSISLDLVERHKELAAPARRGRRARSPR